VQLDFERPDLREIYYEPDHHGDYPPAVVDDYRDCLQLVKACPTVAVLGVLMDVSELNPSRYSIQLKSHMRVTMSIKHSPPEDIAVIQTLTPLEGGEP
jgi:hypothetical protein